VAKDRVTAAVSFATHRHVPWPYSAGGVMEIPSSR